MSDLTRVSAFKSSDEAAYFAGKFKGMGYHVAVTGPTDAIRLANGQDDTKIWESGTEGDWYLVVASKASMSVIANTGAGIEDETS